MTKRMGVSISVVASLFALMFLLCSCSGSGNSAQSNTASNTSGGSSSSANTSSSDATQSSASSSTAGQSVGWPDEFKGVLPTPVGTITGVMRYDEKSLSGKLTIVTFSGMSKENAALYVTQLKGLGFSGGVELSTDTMIMFSGVIKDSSDLNGVNFLYSVSDGTGTISH
jgi:hypothetical protein